jgi:anion transporter
VLAAAAIYFVPPPAGTGAGAMRAAAVIVLTIGLWALGRVPEHVTALLFFLLAITLAAASPQVVFSGFASATLWLVLGGLIVAEAVNVTGLGRRFAALLFDRYRLTYTGLVAAVAAVATALAFVMPGTAGRVLLLLPIIVALAEQVGFRPGSIGYNGLCVTAIIVTYQSGSGILPANAPNLVLAGAAEALYDVQLIYAEWLWVMFPVLALVKGVILVSLVVWLFPAAIVPQNAASPPPRMSAAERRMTVILALALILWATDFVHGVRAGWIALAAAVLCLLPRVGVLPPAAFGDVRLGPFFYIGATVGLGALAQESGLGALLGKALQATLSLQHDNDFGNFIVLSVLGTVMGLVATNPAQPSLLTPLAGEFAQAAGWPLSAGLMTIAVGFTVMVLPYQVPPVVIGMQVTRVSLATMLRVSLPLAAISVVALLPLQYAWWRIIGYFG